MKSKFTQWSLLLTLLAAPVLFSSCSSKADKGLTPIEKPTPPVVLDPTISVLSPNSGVAETEVVISGKNFGANVSEAKVTFGAKTATIVSFSKEEIKVKAPAGVGDGKVSVVVTIATKPSNKLDFDYTTTVVSPVIATITPTCFYNATVTITGTNFSPIKTDNVVNFGAIPGTITEASATSLTVLAPDLGTANSANVTVTTKGATSLGKNITVDVDQNKVATYNWTTHTVKPGVVYKTGSFPLFGSTQRGIYVLDITLNSSNTLGIGFSTTNVPTTTMCANYGAIGGVNAGYFPMSGASDKDGYVRINGVMAQAGHLNVSQIFTNSALIINKNVASVRKFTETHKNLNTVAAAIPVAEAENIIVCGPILITDNVIANQDLNSTHNTSSAARTGVGVSADGKRVFLVVVDTGGSYTGVSTPNLAKILQALGAYDAMNLDGGGSSTMFVKGQGDNGRVNFPSGGTFQRSVRSVVYVK